MKTKQENKTGELVFRLRDNFKNIIKLAYKDSVSDEILMKMCNFYLEVTTKSRKSFHGLFIPPSKIELYNIYDRPSKHTIICIIHELAHKVDYVTRNKSDHSNIFYSHYEKLTHAALDLGYISAQDIVAVRDTSDWNKIDKFISNYKPKQVKKQNSMIISIYNSYPIKHFLQTRGYKYSALSKSWVKEFSDHELPDELEYLRTITIQANISVTDSTDLEIRVQGYIQVEIHESITQKDLLNANGFFVSKKSYLKPIFIDEYDKECSSLKANGLHLNFKLLIIK